MKLLLLSTCLCTSIIFPAANSPIVGPIIAKQLSEPVALALNNRVSHVLTTATQQNKGYHPTGSIADISKEVQKNGILTFIAAHAECNEAHTKLVETLNKNGAIKSAWSNVLCAKNASVERRVLQWVKYIGAVNQTLTNEKKRKIPKIDMIVSTTVRIILNNQKLIFTPEEAIVFIAIIATDAAVAELCHSTDPDAFNAIYENDLPEIAQSSLTAWCTIQ